MAQPAAEAAGPSLWPALWRAGVLAGGLLVAGLVFRARGAELLRQLHPDAQGAAALIVLGGGLCAVGAPRQAVAFAGGFIFGPWVGGGLALLGQLLGCVIDFVAARTVAGGWAQARLGLARGGTAQHRIMRRVLAAPFAATLTLRLLPAGSNLLLNLAAGVGGIPAGPFLAATLLGYVPQTVVFALLGSGTSIGHGVEIAVGAAMFAVSFALGGWLLWRDGARG